MRNYDLGQNIYYRILRKKFKCKNRVLRNKLDS